jgi:hypothetical protein
MHSLRKGFDCRYAGKAPAQVLQKLIRHASISLTMTYDANIDQAAMDALLGSSRVTSRVSEHSSQPVSQDTSTQPFPEQDL